VVFGNSIGGDRKRQKKKKGGRRGSWSRKLEVNQGSLKGSRPECRPLASSRGEERRNTHQKKETVGAEFQRGGKKIPGTARKKSEPSTRAIRRTPKKHSHKKRKTKEKKALTNKTKRNLATNINGEPKKKNRYYLGPNVLSDSEGKNKEGGRDKWHEATGSYWREIKKKKREGRELER